MANKVLIKRSAVQGKNALTTDLSLGELALNTYDGNLFFKKSPGGTDSIVTVVTLDGTQTLTNKTLTSPTINGGALSGTFTGAVTHSDTTASTSTTTGALKVSGGVGVAGTLFANEVAVASGSFVSFAGAGGSTRIRRDGGLNGLDLQTNSLSRVFIADTDGAMTVRSTTASTSTTTGALLVAGGAGIAGTLNAASIRINNSYTLPTADGGSSYVVATNGAGQLSFVDVNTIVVQTLNLSTNQDFGLLTENYTQSVNLGLVTEGFSTSYDWGVIATGGIVYPNQLVLPYYTVAQLPSSEISGQLIFVSNESGGAVPAFSDGTNWRRVTDRVIVS